MLSSLSAVSSAILPSSLTLTTPTNFCASLNTHLKYRLFRKPSVASMAWIEYPFSKASTFSGHIPIMVVIMQCHNQFYDGLTPQLWPSLEQEFYFISLFIPMPSMVSLTCNRCLKSKGMNGIHSFVGWISGQVMSKVLSNSKNDKWKRGRLDEYS